MTIDARGVELLKEITDIDFVEGQKVSRVINKICKVYGFDELPQYNTIFARISAALNPLQSAE